jgi:hypothetical protein
MDQHYTKNMTCTGEVPSLILGKKPDSLPLGKTNTSVDLIEIAITHLNICKTHAETKQRKFGIGTKVNVEINK